MKETAQNTKKFETKENQTVKLHTCAHIVYFWIYASMCLYVIRENLKETRQWHTCLTWEPADDPISRARRWRMRTKIDGSMKLFCTSVNVLMTRSTKLIELAELSSPGVRGAVTVVMCFWISSSTFWYKSFTSGGVVPASRGKATKTIFNKEHNDFPASNILYLKQGSRIWQSCSKKDNYKVKVSKGLNYKGISILSRNIPGKSDWCYF